MTNLSLDQCIRSFKQADQSSLTDLCTLLANRLIHIPIVSNIEDGSNSTRIQIVELKDDDRSLIPIFTSADDLNAWIDKHEHQGDSICLLGADLCAALSSGKHLLINDGSENKIELSPDSVEMILTLSQEDLAGNPEEVSYADRYNRDEHSSHALGVSNVNPIEYHGRVNERNFIKYTKDKIIVQKDLTKVDSQSEAVTIEAKLEKLERDIENAGASISTLKNWNEGSEDSKIRKRKKTTQEGADNAIRAWQMLRESPPLGETIHVKSLADKNNQSHTRIVEVSSLDPKDLGEISKRLQNAVKEKIQKEEKRI